MSLRPSNSEIIAALEEHGSIRRAAAALGYTDYPVRKWIKQDPVLAEAVGDIRRARAYHGDRPETVGNEASGLTMRADEAVITEPATTRPKLGDIGQLIRERGLDPEEWVVVSTTLNEWDGPVKGGGTQRLKQWKVTLKRAPHLILAAPATHIPPVKRQRRVQPTGLPELIVVEGDHQVPYHDAKLHEVSLAALEELHKRHNLVEHVFLGDTGDFPTISKHADHPTAMASVNQVIQGCYDLLRAKREAAPNARARKLKGNHDWRLEGELLLRAERLYGIKPASIDGEEEIHALSLRRLLHLDALGVELVEDVRGWQHGEVELVEGIAGLVVRHGWLTGANTAGRSLSKRGRSMIVGHTHAREHVFRWDPSAGLERQAVVSGTMSSARGSSAHFPHFAVCDSWLQGFVTVTRWPDGEFVVEHARWDGKALHWRDRRWS
ncbi:MAG: hypothetical protein ACXVXP_00395 [Mycobacteriaceae bacterium]